MNYFIVLIAFLTGSMSYASRLDIEIRAKSNLIELFQNFNSRPELREQFKLLKSAEVKPVQVMNGFSAAGGLISRTDGSYWQDSWQMIFADSDHECTLVVFISNLENFDLNNIVLHGFGHTSNNYDSAGHASGSNMKILLRPPALPPFFNNQNLSILQPHSIECVGSAVSPEILTYLLNEIFEVKANSATFTEAIINKLERDAMAAYQQGKSWFGY